MYSAEQKDIIEAFVAGDDVATRAIAGSGKTHLTVGAVEAAGSQGKKGHVFYFGAANAKEGKSKLKCSCSTFDSLSVRENYSMINRRGRLLWSVVAKHLGISNIKAYYTLKAVISFCKSARREVEKRDVVIEYNYDGSQRFDGEIDKAEIAELSNIYFKDMIKPDSKLPVDFSIIFKKWALTEPYLGYDFIVVDEFQDTAPVRVDLIKKQHEQGTQVMVVGDPNQSIMQFTGAINAFDHVDYDEMFLTQSFRNGQAVVDLSAALLTKYGNNPHKFKGLDNGAEITEIENPACWLYRTNYGVMNETLNQIKEGRKPYVVGWTDTLINLVKDCATLQDGRRVHKGDLVGFKSYNELIDYTKTSLGSDLKPLVNAIETYGSDYLVKTLTKAKYQRKDTASTIISTAHKSKGLEFDSVKLGDDFREDKDLPNGEKGLTTQSKNLLYVAITRSLNNLDVSNVEFLKDLY